MLTTAALSWALLVHLSCAASVLSSPCLPPEPHENGELVEKHFCCCPVPARNIRLGSLEDETIVLHLLGSLGFDVLDLEGASSSQTPLFGSFDGFFEQNNCNTSSWTQADRREELPRASSSDKTSQSGIVRQESNSLLNEMLGNSFLKDVGLDVNHRMHSSTPLGLSITPVFGASPFTPLMSSPRPFHSCPDLSTYLDESLSTDNMDKLETILEPEPEPEAEAEVEAEIETDSEETALNTSKTTLLLDKLQAAHLFHRILSYLSSELNECRMVNSIWHANASLAFQLFAGESNIAVPISTQSVLPMPFIVLYRSWLPLFTAPKMVQIKKIIDDMPGLDTSDKDQDALVEESSKLARFISTTLPVPFEQLVSISKWKHVFSDKGLRFLIKRLMEKPEDPESRTELLLFSEAMVLGLRTDLMFDDSESVIEALYRTAQRSEANPPPEANGPVQVLDEAFLEAPIPGVWKVPGVVLHLALQSKLSRLIYFLANSDPSSIQACNALGKNAVQVACDLYIARTKAQSQEPIAPSQILADRIPIGHKAIELQLQEPFELILLQKAVPDHIKIKENLRERSEETINNIFEGALKKKHYDVLIWLLQSPELAKLVNFEAKSNAGQSFLHRAAVDGDPQIWSLLMTFPFSKTAANALSEGGETPLTIAINKEHESIVRMMLEDPRFDVNVPDNYGSMPLHGAVNRRNLECLRLLLAVPEIKIDSRAGKNSSTPLERALKSKWEGWRLFYPCYFPDDKDWESRPIEELKASLKRICEIGHVKDANDT